MSKFMTIAGIILAAVAVALGLMIFFSPSSIVGWGFTPQAVIELLVGGVLSVGLGGVIDAAGNVGLSRLHSVATESVAEIPLFGRRASDHAPTPAAADELSPATTETIKAIEEAKSEISKAFGEESAAPAAADSTTAEPEAEAVAESETRDEEEMADTSGEESKAGEEEPADGLLYVLEEKVVRGRPARILSDGTIEAETDEGWMRFENLDHLNEYLDAMAPGS